MAKSIFTGKEISEDNPYASLGAGVGYTNPYAVDYLKPEQKQEQYVAEHLQAFTEKAESDQGLTINDIEMTARAFIDGLWLNKSEEAGSYIAATMVKLLDPELSQGKTISQIATQMQTDLEAESARFAEERPVLSTVSNIGGSFVSPVSLAAGGILSQAAKLRQGAQAARAADEVGATLGGTFARTGADDASRLAAELGRQQAASRVTGLDPTGKIAQVLARAPTPVAAAGIAGAEGAVIGAEGQTWEEKAKNAGFTAGISAAVPFAFAGVKKGYDFATESKMAQQLGEGADFTNLMFTEHGLSQVYRSVISKAYGGRTLSEQQARKVAGRAAPAAAASKLGQEFKEEAKRKTTIAKEAIKRNTSESIEESGLRIDDKIEEVRLLSSKAKGAEKIEYDNQLALLDESKLNANVAKTLAVKEADEVVSKANATFRGQALRQSSPSGASDDEINALGALDPQDANIALDNLWRKYGFNVANGKTYKVDGAKAEKFIDSISKKYSDLDLIGTERGGIINSVKKYVASEISNAAPKGVMKGEDLIQLRSSIGRAINGLSDASVSTRRFSSEVQDYFHDIIQEGLNKTEKEAFAADRYAWSVRSTVDEAIAKASGGDARGGAFTAEDYLNAVKTFSPRFAARGQGRLQRDAQELAVVTKQNKNNIISLANEQADKILKDAIRDRAKLGRDFRNKKDLLQRQEKEEIAALRRELAVVKATEEGKKALKLRIEDVKQKYAIQMANLDEAAGKAKSELDSLKTLMPSSFQGSVFENLFNTAIVGQAVLAPAEAGIKETLATGFVGARVLASETTQRILARQTKGQQKLRQMTGKAGQALADRGLTPSQTIGAQAGAVGQVTAPKQVLFSEDRKNAIRKMPTSGKANLYKSLEARGYLDRLEAEDPKLFRELQKAADAAR